MGTQSDKSSINISSGYHSDTATVYGGTSKPKELRSFKYERSEIPEKMIQDCNNASLLEGKTYFIFDTDISTTVFEHWKKSATKEEKREIIIDQIFRNDPMNQVYHIADETYFHELPSRFSYYDTETKESDRYKRYKIVTDFLNILGFVSDEMFNFGPEYDQSFILQIGEWRSKKSLIARVKPNLFISIQSGFTKSDGVKYIFDGFFSKSGILEALSKDTPEIIEIIRELKLNNLLNE